MHVIYECISPDSPIFAIYERTKPSSKAKNTIHETEYHHSHLKSKDVWRHQLLTTMLSCGKIFTVFY
ncbi:hypothetical protein OSC52_03840 [Clostridium pasteurianum]|uniref:hypothetical protein n=1 Tax=Clostridium pasteurianum TaxID=1501 RepID=UPI002260CCF4|nr:hypothetical protein [Clostridium pasteurianum]UZW14987.1 hypothetical protein OSC52_03840 [Clostridium pasteurianum]